MNAGLVACDDGISVVDMGSVDMSFINRKIPCVCGGIGQCNVVFESRISLYNIFCHDCGNAVFGATADEAVDRWVK